MIAYAKAQGQVRVSGQGVSRHRTREGLGVWPEGGGIQAQAGGIQAHTQGCLGPHPGVRLGGSGRGVCPGGCIPASTQADPPADGYCCWCLWILLTGGSLVPGGGGTWSRGVPAPRGGACSNGVPGPGEYLLWGVPGPSRSAPGGGLLRGVPGGDPSPRDIYRCRRYASYWNAFLFLWHF